MSHENKKKPLARNGNLVDRENALENPIQKNRENSKNQSEIAACEQKTTSEKAKFCSNTVFSLYFKFRAKKFHAVKPLAFSRHFLFRRDQNQEKNQEKANNRPAIAVRLFKSIIVNCNRHRIFICSNKLLPGHKLQNYKYTLLQYFSLRHTKAEVNLSVCPEEQRHLFAISQDSPETELHKWIVKSLRHILVIRHDRVHLGSLCTVT